MIFKGLLPATVFRVLEFGTVGIERPYGLLDIPKYPKFSELFSLPDRTGIGSPNSRVETIHGDQIMAAGLKDFLAVDSSSPKEWGDGVMKRGRNGTEVAVLSGVVLNIRSEAASTAVVAAMVMESGLLRSATLEKIIRVSPFSIEMFILNTFVPFTFV